METKPNKTIHEIKKVTEEELFYILENKIDGIYYYVNDLERYYCYLVTKEKTTSNIWNVKDFAFKWMDSVLRTHFTHSH